MSLPSASEPRTTHSTAGSTSPSSWSLRLEELREEDGQLVVRGPVPGELAPEVAALRRWSSTSARSGASDRGRVGEARDVADRVDVGERSAEPLVDDHAVVDGRAGRLGELDVRLDADADDREVALHRGAVGQPGAGQELAVAGELLELRLEQELDSLAAIELASSAERSGHASCGMSIAPSSTSVTSSPRRVSEAAASAPMKLPPITIAECASSRAVAHGVGVGEGPLGVDADEVRAGQRQRARPRAGREDERPVGEPLAARELDLVLVRVDPSRPSCRGAARRRPPPTPRAVGRACPSRSSSPRR